MRYKEDFAYINGMLTHDKEQFTMRLMFRYFRMVNVSFTAPSLSTAVYVSDLL